MKIAQSRAHNNTFARQTREVKVANVILSFSKRRTSPTWMREGIGKKAIDEKSYAHKTTKNEQMPNEKKNAENQIWKRHKKPKTRMEKKLEFWM